MKNLRINHMLAVFTALLVFSSVAYATPTISLIPGSPDANDQTEIQINLSGLTTDQVNQLKASGTAFTLECDGGVTLVAGSVRSTFFDLFETQFDKAGTDPDSYTLPLDASNQPIEQPLVVNNEGASKAMIAAARCTPTDNSTENELMTFKVDVTENGCVTLTPTVLLNESAGYKTPTAIDVLVGSSTDTNIEATDPNAYPILIGSNMNPVKVCLTKNDDIDKDELPDSWEYQYFPNDLTKLCGSCDYDNDGLTDKQEYESGSDPTVPDTESLEIAMVEGWNWISSNVLPNDTTLNGIFGDKLSLVKQVYCEGDSATFNSSLGFWMGNSSIFSKISTGKMFKVNVESDFTLTITGQSVPENTEIELYNGWTWIAYLPKVTMNTDDVVNSIQEHFYQIIRADKSRTKNEALGFNMGSLTEMSEGEGYVIKTTSALKFVYPQ